MSAHEVTLVTMRASGPQEAAGYFLEGFDHEDDDDGSHAASALDGAADVPKKCCVKAK